MFEAVVNLSALIDSFENCTSDESRVAVVKADFGEVDIRNSHLSLVEKKQETTNYEYG